MFQVRNIAVCLPQLHSHHISNKVDFLSETPDVSWVAAMQRRRLSAYAKLALSASHQALTDEQPMPIVFSSRHGDLHKTADLLQQVVEREALSPTQFALSVHNAVMGLFSILTNNTQNIIAICGRESSFESALIEAVSQLQANGLQRVLLVHCDRSLPAIYEKFSDEPQLDHCVACIIEASEHSGFTLHSALNKHSVVTPALRFANAAAERQSVTLGQWELRYES